MSPQNKLRVLLDTTYFLPVVGVEIDLAEEDIDKLFSGDFKYMINEITLFELYGKARRYFKSDSDVNRFYEGMKSIIHSDIEIIPVFTLEILQKVLELRDKLREIPDCIISATALIYADVLVTEANDIKRALNMEVLNLQEFLDKYFKF
jgi:predicted nucleic acid-binding protein